MRVLFSVVIRAETWPIGLVSSMLIPYRTCSEFSRNALTNNPRLDECADPLHSYRRDPHICMALRSIQILTYRSDGDLWASHFPFIHRLWDLLLMQPHTVSYRFCSGVYVSQLANPILGMGEPWDVGRRTGMFTSISAFGALTGPPISGAIRSATGDFKAVGYYAGQLASFFIAHSSRSRLFFLGTVVLVGVGMLSYTRYLLLRGMFGKI